MPVYGAKYTFAGFLDPVRLGTPMDGNDTLGDCTIAALAHAITTYRGVAGTKFIMAQQPVVKLYMHLTGGIDSGLDAGGVGDIQRDGQQVLVRAECLGDPIGPAAGGHDRVAGVQGGAGDVGAHAAAGTGDEPDLLVSHGSAVLRSRGSGEPAPAQCVRLVELAATEETPLGGGVAEPAERGYWQGPPRGSGQT